MSKLQNRSLIQKAVWYTKYIKLCKLYLWRMASHYHAGVCGNLPRPVQAKYSGTITVNDFFLFCSQLFFLVTIATNDLLVSLSTASFLASLLCVLASLDLVRVVVFISW